MGPESRSIACPPASPPPIAVNLQTGVAQTASIPYNASALCSALTPPKHVIRHDATFYCGKGGDVDLGVAALLSKVTNTSCVRVVGQKCAAALVPLDLFKTSGFAVNKTHTNTLEMCEAECARDPACAAGWFWIMKGRSSCYLHGHGLSQEPECGGLAAAPTSTTFYCRPLEDTKGKVSGAMRDTIKCSYTFTSPGAEARVQAMNETERAGLTDVVSAFIVERSLLTFAVIEEASLLEYRRRRAHLPAIEPKPFWYTARLVGGVTKDTISAAVAQMRATIGTSAANLTCCNGE